MAPKQWHPHSKDVKIETLIALTHCKASEGQGQGAKAGGNGSKGQGKGKWKASKRGKSGPKGKGPDANDAGTIATEPKPCKCCGKTNHKRADCKHRDKECSVCGKNGHLWNVGRHREAGQRKNSYGT